MPIYEYRCDECGHAFEMIRSLSESDKEVKCPACKGRKVNRLMSVCSSKSPAGRSARDASSCSPGPFT